MADPVGRSADLEKTSGREPQELSAANIHALLRADYQVKELAPRQSTDKGG